MDLSILDATQIHGCFYLTHRNPTRARILWSLIMIFGVAWACHDLLLLAIKDIKQPTKTIIEDAYYPSKDIQVYKI